MANILPWWKKIMIACPHLHMAPSRRFQMKFTLIGLLNLQDGGLESVGWLNQMSCNARSLRWSEGPLSCSEDERQVQRRIWLLLEREDEAVLNVEWLIHSIYDSPYGREGKQSSHLFLNLISASPFFFFSK